MSTPTKDFNKGLGNQNNFIDDIESKLTNLESLLTIKKTIS